MNYSIEVKVDIEDDHVELTGLTPAQFGQVLESNVYQLFKNAKAPDDFLLEDYPYRLIDVLVCER